MVLFDQFMRTLKYYGIHDVILPFILVFTIVFAVLQKSKILGKDSKNFNTVIALVMGLAVVIPHTLGMYGRPSVVDIINAALPQVSLVVIAIVMLMLMLGIFGKNVSFAGTNLSSWAVLFSLAAVIIIFGNAAGWFGMPQFLYFLNDPNIQSLIVIILVFGAIIRFVTHDEDEADSGEFFKNLGNVIKDER